MDDPEESVRPDDSEHPEYHLRRANMEDLPALRELWQRENLPAAELEPRFTEFQLALAADGSLAGALGLHQQNLQGLIHSEAFAEPAQAVRIRPLLWTRIQMFAKNNGLHRLWTLPVASFYREQGMTDIDDALRAKLPEGFGNPMADWVTLRLRDEQSPAVKAEKEFELFSLLQKEANEKSLKQAQALRVMAYGLFALALLGLIALAEIYRRLSKRKR